jgi:hypothetical protein
LREKIDFDEELNQRAHIHRNSKNPHLRDNKANAKKMSRRQSVLLSPDKNSKKKGDLSGRKDLEVDKKKPNQAG